MPEDNAQARTVALAGLYVQLQQSGPEYVGPCTLCKGGTDRFYVRVDGSWGCRKCEKRGRDDESLYAAIVGESDARG